MKHFADEWIQEWCENHGWTDLFRERLNHYWAFPPNAVMPMPIPPDSLRLIKANKGLTREERLWLGGAIALSGVCVGLSWVCHSPLPLVMAFGFSAITSARLEMDEF